MKHVTTVLGGAAIMLMATNRSIAATTAGFQIVEREIPAPDAGQVRIKVQACGVYHSDAIIVEGLAARNSYPLEKAAEAYARMMSGKAEFRVVLTM